jgi:hypothetical protein
MRLICDSWTLRASQTKLVPNSTAYGFEAIFQRGLIIKHTKNVARLHIYQPWAIKTAENGTEKRKTFFFARVEGGHVDVVNYQSERTNTLCNIIHADFRRPASIFQQMVNKFKKKVLK